LKHTIRQHGFTIVELLIVIIVIAILAAITTVAYNGIQQRAVDSAVRSGLSDAVKQLENKKTLDSAYPADLAATGLQSDSLVVYQYTHTASPEGYCLSATSPKSKTLAYHITNTNTAIQSAVCDGHTPPDATVAATPSFVRTASSGGPMNFTVTTNEDWSSLTLTWSAVSGAARYEVMSRETAAASWYYRATANGSSSCSGSCQGNWSGGIPSSTTSVVWTDAISVPRLAGNHYEYRVRSVDSGGAYGNWETVTLENIIMSDSSVPAVTGLDSKLTNDWSGLTMNWNAVTQFTPTMSQVFYEVQSRSGAAGSWYYRITTNGSSSCSGGCYNSWSGAVSNATTSLNWTDPVSVPKLVGNNYEYRIRVRVAGATTYYGAWSNVAVSNPIQADASVPAISGFAVSRAADWSNVVLNWSQMSGFIPTTSQVTYEVQHRVGNGSWYFRLTSDGSSSCSGGCVGLWSGAVPYATTSLTWTSSMSIPTVGTTHEYRIRAKVAGESTYYGPWSTYSLSR